MDELIQASLCTIIKERQTVLTDDLACLVIQSKRLSRIHIKKSLGIL